MNENLKIYEAVRKVPQEAQKPIAAGRLKGKTDINPMWRIKVLTEQFGPVGLGWYTEIKEQWLEQGAGGEIAAFCRIHLYVKMDDEWSKPIEGVGGSMFITNEKNGAYTDDECYKKAYTDAISVACKALGIGADVYWASDRTKYSTKPATPDYSQEKMLSEPSREIPRRVEDPQPNDTNLDLAIALNDMNNAPSLAECKRIWMQWPVFHTNSEFKAATNARKKYFETH